MDHSAVKTYQDAVFEGSEPDDGRFGPVYTPSADDLYQKAGMLYVKDHLDTDRPTPLERTRELLEQGMIEFKEYEERYQQAFAALQIAQKHRDDAQIRMNCLKQALSEMTATAGDNHADGTRKAAAERLYPSPAERERWGQTPG